MLTRSVLVAVLLVVCISVLGATDVLFASTIPVGNQPDYMDGECEVQVNVTLPAQPSKFVPIFISFPDSPPELGYPNSVEIDSLASGLANSLTNQSGGFIDLVPQLVPHPGTGEIWWMADFPIGRYSSDSTVAGIPGGAGIQTTIPGKL